MKHGLILFLGLLVGSSAGGMDTDCGISCSEQGQEQILVAALENKLGISLCNGPALFEYLRKSKVSDPQYQAFMRMIGSRNEGGPQEDLSELCKALIEFQGQYTAMLKQKMEQDEASNKALNEVRLRQAKYRLCAEVVVGTFGLMSLIMNAIQAANLFCGN